ncbi:MAG TPA: PAS domain-containing protein [Thiomicrorhabdus sp.]|nr:PAS domain-containing protein [Thiomicrorhabdus sp.]
MLNDVEQSRLKELEQAFELFNATSMQLTNAYDGLQEQVVHLQGQLAKSDQERRQVADRLSRLLNLLPAGVIVLNEQKKVAEMNPSAEAILGRDALGRDWDIVVMNVFLIANDAGELITHDDVVYQLSEACLDEAAGKILLIQDVTSARALQAHVSRHQRLHSMGEMAASLAHQIRTPLASALLYVSQLNTDKLNKEKREKFVAKALNSLNHLEGLVKDMLQYARGGKGSEQRIELSELFAQLEKNIETQVACSESHVVFEPVDDGLVIMGDKDVLLTALQNLIGNAIDVVGKHATIQVLVNKLSEKQVDLVVVDSGPGVEPELLEKIFEPFYTRRAKGTGLGLAVVRAIAEAHGGKAWVKSIVGHGSRFGIRLPLMSVKEGE